MDVGHALMSQFSRTDMRDITSSKNNCEPSSSIYGDEKEEYDLPSIIVKSGEISMCDDTENLREVLYSDAMRKIENFDDSINQNRKLVGRKGSSFRSVTVDYERRIEKITRGTSIKW